ncbi:hypothetical protein DSECCO2_09350 [anaerobic digester metagenome]
MRNPYLSPYLDSNDKTPVWDGFVYMYNDKYINHPKNTFLGRVQIQIKGKTVRQNFRDRIKHSIDLIDLKAYESEGGSIFVVVLIKEDFSTEIYYKELLQLDLARLIKKSKQKVGEKGVLNLRCSLKRREY